MAYGERFRIDFFDVDENKFRLQIFKDGYTGSVKSNLKLGPNPVQVSWKQSDDYFNPIIGSSCRLQFYIDDATGGDEWEDEETTWENAFWSWEESGLEFLQPTFDREFKVVISYESSSGTFTNYWTGFIVQDQYTIPLISYPYLVEVTASDLIGTIDGFTYDLSTQTPSLFASIRECLKNINVQDASGNSGKSLDFGYKILCRYNSKVSGTLTSNGNPFLNIFINDKSAFNDENGNAFSCKKILKSILQMFNARIFQHEGTWTIIDNASLSLSSFSDGGGSYSKEFLSYTKTGSASSSPTFEISNPLININDTSDNSTLQPLGKSLENIIKSPAIRNKVIIDLKLKSKFDNFNFENTSVNSSGYGFIPSGVNWNIQDTAGASLKNTIVSASTFNSFASVQVGIEPYGGTKSLLAQGSESSAFSTTVATNPTGNIGTTSESLNFSFAYYADDPDATVTSISYSIRYQLILEDSGGTLYYWKQSSNEWVTSSTDGRNTISDSKKAQWILASFNPVAPPVTGTVSIKLYTAHEALQNNSDFRVYYDDFNFKSQSDLKFLANTTTITKSTIKNNSLVINKKETLFGQLGDAQFSNCITNAGRVPVENVKYFDTITSETSLENLACMTRLNDLANNNDRYRGTFRKIKDANGFLNPVTMLTLPKLNFTTFQSSSDHLAIDNLTFNVSKNRIKLATHTPQQSELTTTSDVNNNRSFYQEKPES